MNALKVNTKSHHCGFPGCTNSSKFTPPEIKYHPFAKPCLKVSKRKEEPTQSHLKHCPTCMKCNRWILLGQGAKKWPISLNKIKSSHYVCSLHFVQGHPYSDKFPDPLSVTAVAALRNKRNKLLEDVHAAKRRLVEGGQSQIQKSSQSSDTVNCPSETVDISYRCSKCSHHTASIFQLHHHIQRKHNQVYATELFHAVFEPEQFSCTSCDYKSYYRFELHEHFIQAHNLETETNDDGLFCVELTYSCEYCRKYKSHSSLSLINHLEWCKRVQSTIIKPQDS